MKIGRNDTVMISRLKNNAGTDLACSLDEDLQARLVGWRALEMLVGVLDHDDGAVDHGADRDGDSAQAHDVRPDPQHLHGAERHQDPDRQHDDRNQRAADVQQEDDADERDDDALFRERPLQRLDRVVDQVRTVVDRDDLDAFWQRRRHVGKPRLHVVDDVERILSEALQGDAAGDLAFPVEFGYAPALVRTKLDPRHVLQQDGRSLVDLEHDARQVGDAFDVSPAPHDEFEFRKFDGAPADIHVAAPDCIADFRQRDAE